MSRRQLTPPHNEVQNVFFHYLRILCILKGDSGFKDVRKNGRVGEINQWKSTIVD